MVNIIEDWFKPTDCRRAEMSGRCPVAISMGVRPPRALEAKWFRRKTT
jgi:hypothetical protein